MHAATHAYRSRCTPQCRHLPHVTLSALHPSGLMPAVPHVLMPAVTPACTDPCTPNSHSRSGPCTPCLGAYRTAQYRYPLHTPPARRLGLTALPSPAERAQTTPRHEFQPPLARGSPAARGFRPNTPASLASPSGPPTTIIILATATSPGRVMLDTARRPRLPPDPSPPSLCWAGPDLRLRPAALSQTLPKVGPLLRLILSWLTPSQCGTCFLHFLLPLLGSRVCPCADDRSLCQSHLRPRHGPTSASRPLFFPGPPIPGTAASGPP